MKKFWIKVEAGEQIVASYPVPGKDLADALWAVRMFHMVTPDALNEGFKIVISVDSVNCDADEN